MLHKGISTRLNYAVRFSGYPLERDETIAQHVAAMQFLALELYNQFLKHGMTFDIRDTMYRIAIHDLDESALGDIPRPIKYHDDAVHKELDRVAAEELAKNYQEEIITASHRSKEGAEIEAMIVNILDVLQCVYRLRVSAAISKRYKKPLNESIEVARNKIEALPNDTRELQFLRDIFWKELMDEEI